MNFRYWKGWQIGFGYDIRKLD